MRRKQKTPKQLLEERAIKLWKIACLKMWGNKSIISGEPATVFHHFIPRSRSLALKYDVKNGIPLTNSEHYIIHFSKSPDKIYQLVKKIRQKRGRAWCRYIDRKAKIKRYSYYTEDFVRKQIEKLTKYINK